MKSEFNAFNIKIKKTFLIQYPSGKWGFVGNVPIEAAFIDATDEQIKNLQYGEQFGPKKRVFITEPEARRFASVLGIKLGN